MNYQGLLSTSLRFLLPGMFYVLASYSHLRFPKMAMSGAILLSILFASVEYIFRIPAIQQSHHIDKLSNVEIQVVWVVVTLFLAFITEPLLAVQPKKPELV